MVIRIELGFATDFAGESTQVLEIEHTLKLIAQAGFTHVHWCHEWDGDYIYSQFEMLQIKEWFQKYGLKAKSLHASKGSSRPIVDRICGYFRKDYTSEVEWNRLAGVELIKNRIDLASILGANEIVLHMYLPYVTFQERPGYKDIFFHQVTKSLDELEGYCMRKGVTICLENLLEAPASEQFDQFDYLFGKYCKEFLGFCWDTGHANIVLNNQTAIFGRRYKDRLRSIHINDNMGGPDKDFWGRPDLTCPCDQHKIPWEGTINWDEIAEIISNSAYELPLVLELSCKEPDQNTFLKKSYEAGIRLTESVLKKRNLN